MLEKLVARHIPFISNKYVKTKSFGGNKVY